MYKSAQDLLNKADQMFKLKAPVNQMWQTIAENFYPMRADFTSITPIMASKEPADWLSDSYPVLCARDLANSYESMLRDGHWFEMAVNEGSQIDQAGKLWLSRSTMTQRGYMGLRESGFARAVKQGDYDFAVFGQAVIRVGLRRDLRSLLFSNIHLKDCAWFDDEAGMVGGVVRCWNPTREELLQTFGIDNPKLAAIKLAWAKEPFAKEEVMHIEFPTHMCYDGEKTNHPFMSFYVLRSSCVLLEEMGIPRMTYVVPRFLTMAESPYAYSPATMSSLPDARTLQAMTFTLMEAAERMVRPPLLARRDAVLGALELGPDGVTYIDNDYDERMGEAVRAMVHDKGVYPVGQHERTRVVETLYKGFFLDKIMLPQKVAEQTAYEFAEMMKEYRRNNLPLFQPIEVEYNGQLCEAAFDTLFRGRYFGSVNDIPDSLLGQEIKFKYKSPLSSAEEGTRMSKFSQIQQELTMAQELDPTLVYVVDLPTAFRSAVQGVDVPPEWIASEEQFQANVERQQQMMQAQQAMEAAAQMAAIAPPQGVAA